MEVKTSPPIVVYRETVTKESDAVEGRSPNKHNLFYIKVEPLEDNVYEAIQAGDISEGRKKKKDEQMFAKLNELGISNDEAREYRHVYKGNVFLDQTRGEVHIGEVIDFVMDAFEQVVDQGPLAREPCIKMKVSLVDIKLHEDTIHRGPAQVYPAVRSAIFDAMKKANAVLFEPMQVHLIEFPTKFMAEITKLISSKRGQLLEVKQEGEHSSVHGKLPVSEMIGWSNDLRSSTEGRGVSSLEDQKFEKMPSELQQEIIKRIRNRKGLSENQ
jgi:elongation factor 2